GRPGYHGGGPRGSGAPVGPPSRRLLVDVAARLQGARRPRQMVAAPRARSLCPEIAGRAAEDGLWRAHRCLAARSAAGMGGIAARAGAPCGRWVSAGRTGAPGLARTPRGQPQLAISVVDGADAAGVA